MAGPHKAVGKEIFLLVIGKVLKVHFVTTILRQLISVRVEADGVNDGLPDSIHEMVGLLRVNSHLESEMITVENTVSIE